MKQANAIFGAIAMLAAWTAGAAGRDVQIVEINFETNVIELFNFGPSIEALSGWRFCTHSASFPRIYSSSTGLNGIAIGPGESLFFHIDGDAPDEAGHENFPGSIAPPFGLGPYAVGLYVDSNFHIGSSIADYLQWSVDGLNNSTAGSRSLEAVSGGVWTDRTAWVSTTNLDTTMLTLKAASEGEILHGPDDYIAVPEPDARLLQIFALLCIALMVQRRVSKNSQAMSSIASSAAISELSANGMRSSWESAA